MKSWRSSKLAVACAAVTSLMAAAAPAHAEKRVMLVIGNNDYRNVPKLEKAVNEAHHGRYAEATRLSVMVAENLNSQQFSQTLLAFDNSVGPGDTAFFFFAGHGFEIAGQIICCPSTCRPRATARKSWSATLPCWPAAS